jgi:transposase-like protein
VTEHHAAGDGPAQYSIAEQTLIRGAARAGSAPQCPRCAAHPVMFEKPIGGGSFGLGYRRQRVWYVCPHCRRSAMFDLERGTRL